MDSYSDMDPGEKYILRIILKSLAPVSANEIQEKTGITKYKVLKKIKKLITKGHVAQVGAGRNTKYMPHIESKEMIAQLNIFIERLKKSFQK